MILHKMALKTRWGLACLNALWYERDNADCVQPCCIAENLKHILTRMALAANPMLKKKI